MKIHTCDICGKKVEAIFDLQDVKPEYCADDVEHICLKCNKEIATYMGELNAEFVKEKTRKIRARLDQMRETNRAK